MKKSSVLKYTKSFINRNYRLKVYGMDANGNRINKLVGVAGLIALIGIEFVNKFIERAEKAMADKPVVITTCKYILPMFEEDKDDSKRRPKIEIDMFWGRPRLGIDLPDGTFCCLTYRDGICSEAQAFGDKGIAFAASIKEKIDYYINQ